MVGQAVVPDHLRTAALGLQALLFRAFGSIPLPVIAAKIIDSKCYWWGTSCMNERGACRAFDKYGMRTRNTSYSNTSWAYPTVQIFMHQVVGVVMTRQKLRNNCYYTEIIKHTMLLHIHQVHKFSRSFEKRTTWKRLIRFVMWHY